MKTITELPTGNTHEELLVREQFIKDYYATWIANNPEKKVFNRNLNAYIHIKFHSINETAERAARSYQSTCEIIRLTDILANAVLIEEKAPKQKTRNQKPYEKMLIMREGNAKLVIGLQRSTQEYVQYCITSPKE